MPSDLELRAKLTIEADTRGADQTRAALRGVQAEAAKTGQATAVDKQGDAALAFLRQHPAATGGQLLAPAATKLPQSTLDAIRGTLNAGGSRKDAEAALLALGADAATIAAVTGTGKTGAPVPPAAAPAAHPAAAAAPRGPGGASLKQTAEDAEKVGKSLHLTDNEAVRFGASLVGLGIGISAFSFAGRIMHDTLTGIVTVGIEAERQARVTGVAFGQEAAGLTAFAQSVRESSGFTRDAILSAAGAGQSLVTSGKLSQQQLEGLVRIGTEYAQITGQDVTKTTAALADAVEHGGNATGILNGKLSDANVAANAAGGAFATTFRALSDGQQAQIRFAYLTQLGTENMRAANDEAASMPGKLRMADTAMHDAAVAAASWGLAQKAVDLYVDALKEAARWAKLGLAAGDPSHDPVLAALLGAGAARTNAQDTDAAYAQARDEILSMAGVTDQLTTAQGRLTVSTEIQARAEELLRQKQDQRKQAAMIGDAAGAEDYSRPGGPWDVVKTVTAKPPTPAVSPNVYPQQYAQAQSQVQSITYAIGLAQRENLDLTLSETHAQQALLAPKRDILDIEYQINRATDARLGLIDQERVLRAQMAAIPSQDRLADLQTREQELRLQASLRGDPGRGAARAELRRMIRSQVIPRAELDALQLGRGVTAAERTARDDANAQQLRLLPLQQIQAGEQKILDQRQHEVDLINLAREADKLRVDEFVNGLTRMQRAAQDAEEAARKAAAFSQPGGTSLPWNDQRNAAFSLPGLPGGLVNTTAATINVAVPGMNLNITQQPGEDSAAFAKRLMGMFGATFSQAVGAALSGGALPPQTPGAGR